MFMIFNIDSMKTFAEAYIAKQDIEIFQGIRRLIDSVDGFDIGGELTCHDISRAVAGIFPVRMETGYYFRGFEHSWLRTENRNIIDVYPVGVIGGPILVAYEVGQFLYRPEVLKNVDTLSDTFDATAKIIEEALRQKIKE